MQNFSNDLQEIKKNLKLNRPNAKLEIVEEAFYFAKKAHEGQLRESGEPYFTHPIAVAKALAEKGMNETVIAAGLLHDTIEDTKINKKQIKEIFGKKVSEIVDGLTKLKLATFTSKQEETTAASIKTLIAASKDIRVLIIKIFDKIHNLETLKYLPKEKQERIASNALTVYAPLAHKLGMHAAKFKIEDICFSTINPIKYNELKKKLEKAKKEKLKEIKKIISTLKKNFKETEWKFGTESKSIYATYSKMNYENKTINEINDSLILNIIVPKKEDCYLTLGKIHSLFKPIPGKIKDYIAMPEHEIYEAIHTQVIGPMNKVTKIYIYSEEMREVGWNGILALMKHNGKKKEKVLKICSKMFSQVKNPEINDEKELQDSLNLDSHNQRIIVFTHDGKIMELPKDSTVLDFAFFKNDKKSKYACKGKVNGKIVPLWTKLKSGDRVKIFSSRTIQMDYTWLSFCNARKTKAIIEKTIANKRKEKNKNQSFVKLKVDAIDKPGLLSNQLKIISDNQMDLETTSCKMYNDRTTCYTEFYIRKKKIKNLQKALKELKQLPETLSVTAEYLE